MDIIREAFQKLYPEKEFVYTSELTYSGQFKPYNARVQWRGNHFRFRLSRTWKEVDGEITMGLLQVLLLRVLKDQKTTFNIELYHSFLKKLPAVTVKGESDAFLVQAFERVNRAYFFDIIDQPTLQWGSAATTKLAHYDLHTDTIVVSSIFQDAPIELLDYVMYHEMLHKKHQFVGKGKHSRFHTTAFRDDELKFSDAVLLEQRLKMFLREKKRKLRRFRLFSWL